MEKNEQLIKLEDIYRHNDYDYKNVMRNMLDRNHEEMNKNWYYRNQQRENIKKMGIDSKQKVIFFN